MEVTSKDRRLWLCTHLPYSCSMHALRRRNEILLYALIYIFKLVPFFSSNGHKLRHKISVCSLINHIRPMKWLCRQKNLQVCQIPWGQALGPTWKKVRTCSPTYTQYRWCVCMCIHRQRENTTRLKNDTYQLNWGLFPM